MSASSSPWHGDGDPRRLRERQDDAAAIVIGFVRADRGTVSVGERWSSPAGVHVTPDKRAIGYVAQEGALFPHLTVAENVAFGLPRAERETPPAPARCWTWSA